MIDVTELCQVQEKLDNRIIAEKNIDWTPLERFRNTVVALDVELSEFANEGRWFKRWSNDQKPRTHKLIKVGGNGSRETNPLLEEYVDALHFFLSLANQKGWQDHLYLYEEAILELEDEGFQGGLNGIFLEIKYFLAKMVVENDDVNYVLGLSKREYCFKNAWFCFIGIGLVEYKFTLEQVFEAYLEKNKENHRRQDSGY